VLSINTGYTNEGARIMRNMNFEFSRDPAKFSIAHVISEYKILNSKTGMVPKNRIREYEIRLLRLLKEREGIFDILEESGQVSIQAQFFPEDYADYYPVRAYYLPFEMKIACRVDIQRYNPPKKFLFIPHLNGCSVIIAPGKEPGVIWVYRDPYTNSSLVYENVMEKIDYSDYNSGKVDKASIACAFMYYIDSEKSWFLHYQKQEQDLAEKIEKICDCILPIG
jgi:hypothetical protein